MVIVLLILPVTGILMSKCIKLPSNVNNQKINIQQIGKTQIQMK